MNDSGSRRWLSAVILAGALYLTTGVTSANLAGGAASDRSRFLWRLSAFVISAVVFAAHIAYEHFGLHNAARPTAWHASLGVACGAFGLALVANIHDLGSASGYRPRMLVALAAWPLLTAVPAFVAALGVAAGLGVKRRRA
jgi:hypothetical protein